MHEIILVGAGFAGSVHWLPAIRESSVMRIIGVVDISEEQRAKVAATFPDIWAVESVEKIPAAIQRDTMMFVVTPDHLPVVAALAAEGFKNLVVEKPLVSRSIEIRVFRELVTTHGLVVYAVDHYFQKFFALQVALGGVNGDDPRLAFLNVSGDHSLPEVVGCLSGVEGVSYANIEAGDLGIPYLDIHPWLESDPEIGGIIRDLGPHAFAPLVRLGLLHHSAEIYDVGLAKLTSDRLRFEPVRRRSEIEMYVRLLAVSGGITLNVAFGKAPFSGKERSLAVRAASGLFFAGLQRGQPSVLVTPDGKTTRLSLRISENAFVVEEARLFHEGLLPGFDGNLTAALTALEFGERVREKYFAGR